MKLFRDKRGDDEKSSKKEKKEDNNASLRKKNKKQLKGLAKWEAKEARAMEREKGLIINVDDSPPLTPVRTNSEEALVPESPPSSPASGTRVSNSPLIGSSKSERQRPSRLKKSLKEQQQHALRVKAALDLEGNTSGASESGGDFSDSSEETLSWGLDDKSSASRRNDGPMIDNHDCIVELIEGKLCIQAGSISRLVEWMIFTGDMQHVKCFLYTYRAFVGPKDLWEILMGIELKIKASKSPERRKQWTKRTIDFLRTWIEEALYIDFKTGDNSLFKKLSEWVNHHLPQENTNEFKLLLMRKKRKVYTLPEAADGVCDLQQKRKGSFTEGAPWRQWSPTVIAQQLTLQIFDMFSLIQPSELLNQNWQKPDKAKLAPTLDALTQRFNDLSFWVATEIVCCQGLKEQASLIKRFVATLDRLVGMNNFFALMAIMSGLDNTAVKRLKAVWELVPERFLLALRKLEDLMSPSHNFKNYRNHLRFITEQKHTIPIIPYLVVYLKDVTFINDGNPNFLEREGLKFPNFDKMKLLGSQLLELRGYQRTVYEFAVDEEVQEYFSSLFYLDDDDLYARSCDQKPFIAPVADVTPEDEEKIEEEVIFTNPLLQFSDIAKKKGTLKSSKSTGSSLSLSSTGPGLSLLTVSAPTQTQTHSLRFADEVESPPGSGRKSSSKRRGTRA